MSMTSGFFDIRRVHQDISFEDFYQQFFITETPVIIEGIGQSWPATSKWSIPYLQDRLSNEASVSSMLRFFKLDRHVLADDFTVPTFIKRLNNSPEVFPYRSNARIWINTRNNVSSWHYDNGMVSNFNTQITGKKDWILVSPQTPIACYPYSSYGIFDKEEKILKNKIYTKFMLNQGDMLYLPPLWQHTVKAIADININLCWVYTKRKTEVSSPALVRDQQRYLIDSYLSRHRLSLVRKLHTKLMSALPAYLNNQWLYDEMIESGMNYNWFDFLVMIIREDSMILRAILSYPQARKVLLDTNIVPVLKRSSL